MFMSRFALSLSLALALVVPVFVFAAGSTTTTITSTTTTVYSSATTTKPNAVPPPTIPAVSSLSPLAQNRITNLAANLSNREDATVRRLTNVSTRLDSRIAILEAAGQDMSKAKSHLKDARSKLDLAKVSLATIDKSVAIFVGASNPRESWVNLKLTYTTINTNIRIAYEAMKAALAAAESPSPLPPVVTSTTTASSSH